MSTGLELVLLGTGSPLPSPDRCGAGQVVIAGGARILVDCGWGTARRLFAAGILPATVDTLCLTHLHSDHITDLPDFLIMRWTGGATTPLTVYGPAGTRKTMDGFLGALGHDIRFRVAHHGEKLSPDGIRCVVQEVPAEGQPLEIAEVGGAAIYAFAVDHFPVVPALGFRVERSSRSLVISGDTKDCDSLVKGAHGADLLVCEAMNRPMWRAMLDAVRAAGNANTASLLEDAMTYHAGTDEAAAMARKAGVRHLVLTHLMPALPPDQDALISMFVAGMADVFTGNITVGRDLLRISVGDEEDD